MCHGRVSSSGFLHTMQTCLWNVSRKTLIIIHPTSDLSITNIARGYHATDVLSLADDAAESHIIAREHESWDVAPMRSLDDMRWGQKAAETSKILKCPMGRIQEMQEMTFVGSQQKTQKTSKLCHGGNGRWCCECRGWRWKHGIFLSSLISKKI